MTDRQAEIATVVRLRLGNFLWIVTAEDFEGVTGVIEQEEYRDADCDLLTHIATYSVLTS